KDDGFTLFWAPYPFRRPGQPWSVAINIGLFRYINSSTTLFAETELGDQHRSAFGFSQTYTYPKYRLNGELAAQQDIFGSRVVAKTFGLGPLFAEGPSVE